MFWSPHFSLTEQIFTSNPQFAPHPEACIDIEVYCYDSKVAVSKNFDSEDQVAESGYLWNESSELTNWLRGCSTVCNLIFTKIGFTNSLDYTCVLWILEIIKWQLWYFEVINYANTKWRAASNTCSRAWGMVQVKCSMRYLWYWKTLHSHLLQCRK